MITLSPQVHRFLVATSPLNGRCMIISYSAIQRSCHRTQDWRIQHALLWPCDHNSAPKDTGNKCGLVLMGHGMSVYEGEGGKEASIGNRVWA